LYDINNITNRIKSSEIKDPKLKSKAYEKISIVDEKIISKNKDLSRIMNEIVEKEKNYFSNDNYSYIKLILGNYQIVEKVMKIPKIWR
jgi:hypothetical protein